MKRWADQGIYFRKTYVAFVCFWENRENCPFGHIADSFLPFLRDESPFIRKAAALKFVFQENCIENTTADFLVCNFFEKFVTKSLGVAADFFQIFVTPRINFLQFSLKANFSYRAFYKTANYTLKANISKNPDRKVLTYSYCLTITNSIGFSTHLN